MGTYVSRACQVVAFQSRGGRLACLLLEEGREVRSDRSLRTWECLAFGTWDGVMPRILSAVKSVRGGFIQVDGSPKSPAGYLRRWIDAAHDVRRLPADVLAGRAKVTLSFKKGEGPARLPIAAADLFHQAVQDTLLRHGDARASDFIAGQRVDLSLVDDADLLIDLAESAGGSGQVRPCVLGITAGKVIGGAPDPALDPLALPKGMVDEDARRLADTFLDGQRLYLVGCCDRGPGWDTTYRVEHSCETLGRHEVIAGSVDVITHGLLEWAASLGPRVVPASQLAYVADGLERFVNRACGAMVRRYARSTPQLRLGEDVSAALPCPDLYDPESPEA